ncbi:MAG: rod shape-determining protein MreD [Thermodesulfobacteriota bacterium]
MKIFFLSLGFGFFFLIIKTAVLGFFFPPYLIPDIILVLVFFLGVHLPSWKGVVASFILGYLADTFAGGIIGISSFSLISIFLVLHLLSKKVDFNIIPLKVIGLVIAGIMNGLIMLILLKVTNSQIEVFNMLVLSNVLITASVGPLLLFMLDKVNREN